MIVIRYEHNGSIQRMSHLARTVSWKFVAVVNLVLSCHLTIMLGPPLMFGTYEHTGTTTVTLKLYNNNIAVCIQYVWYG